MPRYGLEYVKKVGEEASALADLKAQRPLYEINVPDGFAEVPVQEMCRMLDASGENGLSFDDKLLLARYMTLGRRVEVFLDGKLIGAAQMSGMRDMLDAFPVWKEHHPAFNVLMNVCEAYLLKKSLPPRKGPQAGAAGQAGQAGSGA